MAKVLISDTYLSDIADSIRAKTGGVNTMTPAQMASEIDNIPTGGGDEAMLGSIMDGTCRDWDESTIPGIRQYGFIYNTALKTCRARACKTLAQYAFNSASGMKLLYMPELMSLEAYSVYSCGSLNYAWLGKVTNIPSGAFNASRNVAHLVIASPTVCTLGNSSEFPTSCRIYVPSDLVDSYKAATNWSSHASYIQAITDSVQEMFDNYVAP